MARGFESKAVESAQQEQYKKPRRVKKSREQVELEHKRKSIELDRTRIARDLESATSQARRTSLEHALQHLDDELRKLDG